MHYLLNYVDPLENLLFYRERDLNGFRRLGTNSYQHMKKPERLDAYCNFVLTCFLLISTPFDAAQVISPGSGQSLFVSTSGKPRPTHVANSVSGIDATGLVRVEVSNKT